MNLSRSVREYFSSSPHSFWKWAENGEVVEWRSGGTIAFREELRQILLSLAPQGLPPFGSVLLLIASTREWRANNAEKRSLLDSILRDAPAAVGRLSLLYDVLEGLESISQFEPERLGSVRGKAALAQLVFEDADKLVRGGPASMLAEALVPGMAESLWRSPSWSEMTFDARAFGFELSPLRDGLANIDKRRWETFLETSLTEIPDPIDDPVPPSVLAKRLIQQLVDDAELGVMARAAQVIMSFMSPSSPLSQPDDFQDGGLSDIGNRGPLDQLLLTELAQDKDILAVRLAMNEALFLKREVPRCSTPVHRVVILEQSIRNWGVPRTLCLATALGVIASSDPRWPVTVWMAMGNDYEQVVFRTRDDVLRVMASLTPDWDSSGAICKIADELDRIGDEFDPIVITTTDSMETEEEALRESFRRFRNLEIAALERHGGFELWEMRDGEVRKLKSATLDLDRIFRNNRSGSREVLDKNAEYGELDFLFRTSFPLRLAWPPKASWWVSEQWLIAITEPGFLLKWGGDEFGPQLYANELPSKYVRWTGPTIDNKQYVLLGKQRLHYVLIDHEKMSWRQICETQPLHDEISTAFVHRERIFVVSESSATQVTMMDTIVGNVLHSQILPPRYVHITNRFCFDYEFGEWAALSHETESIQLPCVFKESSDSSWATVLEFEQPWKLASGRLMDGGIYGVTSAGKLQDPAGSLVPGWEFPRIGNYDINVRFDQSSLEVKVDNGVRRVGVSSLWRPRTVVQRGFDLHGSPRIPVAVGITDDFELCIVIRNGKTFVLSMSADAMRLEISHSSIQDSFRFDAVGPVQGCSLAVARWDNGCKAYYDSRGILHLVKPDPSSLQISILLVAGEVAGCSSDGRMWGPDYFTAGESDLDSRAAYEDFIEPFILEACGRGPRIP